VQAHPTKWTLVVWAKMRTGKPLTLLYDYDTQAEAEADLVKGLRPGTGCVERTARAGGRAIAELAKTLIRTGSA
jgi:hypothetical protein